MTTQYTPILKLALPVTGELNGTWGTVVNENITEMVEQAIAGLATINTWTTNSHTLTTADGTTSESRCAMLVFANGSGGSALSGAGQVICPNETKIYLVKNDSTYAVTLKTSAGSGIAVQPTAGMVLFCDGANVYSATTVITPRVVSTATGATTTVNINYDQTVVTALDVNTNVVAGGDGSASNGQKIVLRITASGGTRGITWDSAFRAIGVTLPTTIADTKTLYVGMIYNSVAAKWDVVATSTQS